MLSVKDALDKLTDDLTKLGAETVTVAEAHNRTLAQPVISNITQPPFSSSAMDGYALKHDDIIKIPQTLDVIGESSAGHVFSGNLQTGQAVRIFTGAVVPEGADTVVIQENTETSDNKVKILEPADKGKNIRLSGADFSEGDTLLQTGKVLTARDLSLIAAMNHAHVKVTRKPQIAILATGDELVEPGTALNTGQIVSSIPSGLSAMINSWGAQCHFLGIANDTKESLKARVNSAKTPDIIITIGGASVGDHDLVQTTLKELGMKLNFWKIAMRPGKPLMSGKIENTKIIGLPGNPVSAFICAKVFLSQMIYKLLGQELRTHQYQKAFLSRDLEKNGPREHYMRAKCNINSKGLLEVSPANSQDSSLLKTLSESNCLIIRPPYAPEVREGEIVNILPLED